MIDEVRIDRKEWDFLVSLKEWKDEGQTDWKSVRKQIDKIQKQIEDDEYIMQPEDELIINPTTGHLQIKQNKK